jgi:hypothetical protein
MKINILIITLFSLITRLNAQVNIKNEVEISKEILKDSLKMSDEEVKYLKKMIELFTPKPRIETNLNIDAFFKNVSTIEIFAYLDRNKWEQTDYDNFINDKKNIKEKYLKNKISLKKNEIEKLKNELKKGEIGMSYKCFDPRHLIIFYDEKNNEIGYIELCFDCKTTKSSSNVKSFERSVFNLINLFQELGITYYGENED